MLWVFLTLSLKGETFKEHFCNIDTFSTRKLGDKDEGNIKWGILFLSTLSLERLYDI